MGGSSAVTTVTSPGSAGHSGRGSHLGTRTTLSLRRRLALTGAVVAAFTATVVVLALTSTIVARVG
jgi:hypothetical protein